MKNIGKASELRIAVKGRNSLITRDPGIYRWWFDEEGAKAITRALPDVDFNSVQKRDIDGRVYYALYFGIAKSLRQRLNWHLNQRHSPSTVKKGFLSTLRQTLSALLGIPESETQQTVNDFQDRHCYVEFEQTSSRETAEDIERDELSEKYYPLNIQGNKGVPKQIINRLSELRKQYKQ